MKKLLSLALTVCIALSLASCRLFEFMHPGGDPPLDPPTTAPTEPLTEYQPLDQPDIADQAAYPAVTSRYSYRELSDDLRLLYDRLVDEIYQIDPDPEEELGLYPMPEVRLSGVSLDEAQVRTVIKAIYDDNPEIFWMSGTIGHLDTDTETRVQLYSNFLPDEVSERLSAVAEKVNAFNAGVPVGLSDYQLAKYIHDYLIDNCAYDEDVATDDTTKNDPDIYNVYGALCDGLAVCEGYGRSYQMLCNGLGLDCVCITGIAEDELHLWNAVLLDGSWCGVDPTWDDHDEIYRRYAYFGLTDQLMYENHTPSLLFSKLTKDEINGKREEGYSAMSMNIFIPACDDPSYSYYIRECAHLEDPDNAYEVQEALLAAAQDQQEYFVFYIDPAYDFQSELNVLFREQPQYFFGYVDEVNARLYDYSIDAGNLGYYPIDRLRIVAVELHYY